MTKMISVAMASYNGEKYIKKQLDSILAQTRSVDEIIIVDDQSTDHTREVVEEYIKNHPEMKFVFSVNEKNQGYKRNFKIALSKCRGDYIFLCDQDDIWMPNKVEKMTDIMEKHPNIQVLASSFSFIDGEDNPFEIEQVKGLSNNNLLRMNVEANALVQVTFETLLTQNSFQGCALVVTKALNEKFQKNFTEDLFHDWLLNLFAAEVNGMYFINKPLFLYRIHEKNTIGINEQEHFSNKERAKKRNELKTRVLFAQYPLKTLKTLEKNDPDLIKNQPDYRQRMDFYQNHIQYLTNRNIVKLFLQNFSPYYKGIKTRKARIMDLIFVIWKKKQV